MWGFEVEDTGIASEEGYVQGNVREQNLKTKKF